MEQRHDRVEHFGGDFPVESQVFLEGERVLVPEDIVHERLDIFLVVGPVLVLQCLAFFLLVQALLLLIHMLRKRVMHRVVLDKATFERDVRQHYANILATDEAIAIKIIPI